MKPGELKAILSSIRIKDYIQTYKTLHKIVLAYLRDPSKSYATQYQLSHFNSKNIEGLLTLLESSFAPTRKMAILLIGLLLKNPLSKVFFLEKCGLSLVVGKTFLSRLKYVSNFANNSAEAFSHMKAIMSEVKTCPVLSSNVLLWYVPLNVHKAKMPKDFRPKIKELFFNHMDHSTGEIDLKGIPDPVFNLCGVDFTSSDKEVKLSAKGQNPQAAFSKSAITHTRKPHKHNYKNRRKKEIVNLSIQSNHNHKSNPHKHQKISNISTQSTILKGGKMDIVKKRLHTLIDHQSHIKKLDRRRMKLVKHSMQGEMSSKTKPRQHKMPLKTTLKQRARDIRRNTAFAGSTKSYNSKFMHSKHKLNSSHTKQEGQKSNGKVFRFGNTGFVPIKSMRNPRENTELKSTEKLFSSGIEKNKAYTGKRKFRTKNQEVNYRRQNRAG